MIFLKTFTAAAKVSSLGIAALLALAALSPAFGAQDMRANVPFEFKVGAKTMPAGSYEFKIDRPGDRVTALGPHGSDAMELIHTTLATPPRSNEKHGRIVFDELNGVYTLSELWEPGMDGIVVGWTKEKHKHHIIQVK